MFKIANASQFNSDLKAAVALLRREADETYRGFVTAVFHRIATETPQWSGNAVSNWNVSVGMPDLSVTFALKEAGAKTKLTEAGQNKWLPTAQKGDTKAIALASRRFRQGSYSAIAVGVPTYISNASKNLDDETYIQYLEENRNNFLRPVNYPGHMVERVSNSANALGRLSPVAVEALRFLRPGDLSNSGVAL